MGGLTIGSLIRTLTPDYIGRETGECGLIPGVCPFS